MAQPENRPSGNRTPPGAPEGNFNWRGVVLFALAILLIGGALVVKNDGMANAKEISYPEFLQMIEAEDIPIIKDNPQYPFELVSEPGSQTNTLRGFLKGKDPSKPPQRFKVQVNLLFLQESLSKTLEDKGCVPHSARKTT